MIFIELLIGFYLLGSFIHFQMNKKKTQYETSLITNHINANEELKKTLAMGLYLRYRSEREDYKPNIKENSTFLKQDPYAFETFVANIIQSVHGGTTWVTPSVGDFGVDFEHTTNDGKRLGQVKCYKDLINYEPIAILHSNMVKQHANAGYLVTTSSFTEEAKKYAKDLNIELIDGVKLVELWMRSFESTESEIKELTPRFIN